jgi:branched-chain amino acid aminotransferase
MYYNNDTILYLNGEFVKAVDAKTNFYGQTLHYGYGVFEGIRSYQTVKGETRIFKAEAHYERLKASAQALNLPYTYSASELIKATYALLEKNNIQDAYIRPLVYAPDNMSFNPNSESFLVIEVWKMDPFLGKKLLKVKTSSFQRPNPKGFKIEAKATGHYVNSILASHEAKAAGYDEALLLDMNDHVAEAPGANIFYEKDEKLYTPPLGYILPGITRATIFEICNELNIEVVEKESTVQDIYDADAAFFCGTAAEVIGIESLDNNKFGKLWKESVSKEIQEAYKNIVIENKTVITNEVLGVE